MEMDLIDEIAVEKGATALLIPVTCRRQLMELSDEMATKVLNPVLLGCTGRPAQGDSGITSSAW